MKRTAGAGFLLVSLMLVTAVSAQTRDVPLQPNKEIEATGEIKVRNRTVMEQYEPGMVLTVDDRIRLKEKRLAEIRERMRILDTLSIPDRRKKRLLRALYQSPHSNQWEKLIADLEFEDDQ